MDVRVGLWRKLSTEELMLLNCGVGEDFWESLGLQEDPTSPFWRRSALGFFGRTDAKAETPVLWPPHAKSWLIGKDSDAGRDWGQEERRMTEDEMAGWHHWLDGRESEWTPGVGDGQGGLACCSVTKSRGHNWATELNWTERKLRDCRRKKIKLLFGCLVIFIWMLCMWCYVPFLKVFRILYLTSVLWCFTSIYWKF